MIPQNDRRKTSRLYNNQLPSLFDGPAEPPPQQDLDPSAISAPTQPESFSPIFEEAPSQNPNDPNSMDFSYPRMQNPPILDEHPLDYDRDRLPYEPFAVSPAMGNDFSSLNPMGYAHIDPNSNNHSAGSTSGSALTLGPPSAPALTEGLVRLPPHHHPQQPHLNGSMGRGINGMASFNNPQFLSGNYTGLKKWDDEDSQTSLQNTYNENAQAGGHANTKPQQPVRAKSAHNLIEQRYRNKINDRFTALQMLVPTLRVIAKKSHKNRSGSVGSRDEDDEEEDDICTPLLEHAEDLEGLEPARKLNKGTILAKSIEYIKFLERKNERIKMEHRELIERARMMGIQIDESLLDGR